MSIAVSTLVRTPVCFRLLQACLGACAVLAAWPLSGCWPVVPTPMHSVGAYAWPLPLAIASGAGGAWLLALCCRRAAAFRLDISPAGQLHLAVYLDSARLNPVTDANPSAVQQPSPAWRLLPGSTLWPSLLVLCLAAPDARCSSVLVQRGARSCSSFRALAVACRTLAAGKGQGGDKK